MIYGGTGFYHPLKTELPNDIEHHMPDYHLYDEYVAKQAAKGTEFSKGEIYKELISGKES